jgi:hypothetical protein
MSPGLRVCTHTDSTETVWLCEVAASKDASIILDCWRTCSSGGCDMPF